MWNRPFLAGLASFLLLAAGCGGRGGEGALQAGAGGGSGRGGARPDRRSGGEVEAQMRGVDFRISPDAALEVRHLRGALLPTHEGQAPFFDEPTSFMIRIDQGEIAVTPAGMSALLNEFVFNDAKAPIKDVEIEIRDGHLVQRATLNKKVKVKATLEGDLSTTPDGKIRFHPSSIKAAGVPVKGLLNLFGIELDEMIKTQASKGVSVVDNDLLLDPERLLPPPRVRGKVIAVRLEPDRIVQVFGGGRTDAPIKPSFPEAKNYMFFRGGDLAFGKLTMHGADLQIIDRDPGDPFNFFLSQFARQLVAGYSKTLPDMGLAAYMPDFDEVGGGDEAVRTAAR